MNKMHMCIHNEHETFLYKLNMKVIGCEDRGVSETECLTSSNYVRSVSYVNYPLLCSYV